MNKMVKLYGFEDCPYCQELKGMYDENGIEYTYVDVTLDENEKETNKVFELTGDESVPVVLVNKTLLAPDSSFKTIGQAYELTLKFLNT
jgi:glutaredoxin